jgi:tetratricopeptide (TPR) repeat protein
MKSKTLLIFSLLASISTASLAGLDEDILAIQKRWAIVNYDTAENAQDREFGLLTADARKLAEANPERAEPLVWLAIILSSDAGATGGIGALGKVKEARKLLEQAEQINPAVLNGSIYTSLGSLYYQVPSWPIGFGSDKKAEQYLKRALEINPDGIDPNYFYGDFMLEEGNYAEAIRYLEKAQQAPPRLNRALADKGRQGEIASKLERARGKL